MGGEPTKPTEEPGIDNEERLRLFFEAAQESIILNADGIILDANQHTAAMFGCDPSVPNCKSATNCAASKRRGSRCSSVVAIFVSILLPIGVAGASAPTLAADVKLTATASSRGDEQRMKPPADGAKAREGAHRDVLL